MIRAYIALRSGAGEYLGTSKTIKERLAKISGVIRVDLVFGRFDIMVIVEVNDMDELSCLVDEIKGIPNVDSTETFTTKS